MRFLFFSRFCLFVSLGLGSVTYSYGNNLNAGNFKPNSQLKNLRDTTDVDEESSSDSVLVLNDRVKKGLQILSLDPSELSTFPAISLQQMLKGQAAGLYVQEPSGEPGTVQNMFIRGVSMPLLSAKELYASQPLVILDGVPLTADHPIAYDIQQYRFNRIGPATNPLAIVEMSNLASVEVLKDLSAVAMYGPKAANGVILLTTKKPGSVRKITFDSYVGLAQKSPVTTINGQFENAFRKQFYDKYTSNGLYSENDAFPLYLSDSLNNNYYGPANWNDSYYRNGLVYSANASISGGTDRANFRFNIGTLRNEGVADNTASDRHGAKFSINVKPMQWLTFAANINANMILRERNRSVRDRLAQVNYLPDLSSPLSPNNASYTKYLAEFDKGFDDNKSNSVQGTAFLGVDLGKFKISTTAGADYNEGYRDIFFPRTLMQTTNYASNYFGYNQRLFIDNIATYDLNVGSDHVFNFELGNNLQFDTYRYNYAYAYKGSNDYIKLNLLRSDPNAPSYLEPYVFSKFLVYKILDKTRNNMVSFNGKVTYEFQNKYTFSALLRADGSSNQQPTSRWFYSPVFFGSWDMKKEFMEDSNVFSDLKLRASVGRLGKYEAYDNFGQGPQYTAFIGFTGNLIAPGYNGFATLTRPYNFGYVGYDLGWAYTDQLNVGLDVSFLNNRLSASVDLYAKEDKNQLLAVPGASEYGYTGIYRNGLAVSNKGIDVTLNASILSKETSSVSWSSALNFNFNRNKLTALPDGLNELAIGNRLLKVGESVDSYWMLENDGIYNSDAEVPTNASGEKMTYRGITLKGGDARWKDLNGDNVINDNDKVLTGHALPVISGGFNNTFTLKNWSLDLNFYYNLGRDLINQEMANRFDFINREGLNDINSAKEITFWEKRGEYAKYPIYNPWSSANNYQVDQDLFLENASFLKLRTVSVGYDLTSIMKKKSANINRFYIYGSVNNVFTLTKYTGQDPELVDYTGYDTGYGIQIPRTFTLGVKMDL